MKIATLYDKLASPAQRALQGLKLAKVEELSRHTRIAVSELHGIGPAALATIEAELQGLGLAFKKAEGATGAVTAKAGAAAKSDPGDSHAGKGAGASPIDEYISQFPKATRDRLKEIRRIIREEAPEAAEKMAYRMPTFVLGGNLIHFAGYERHIGIYPTPSGIEAFKAELDAYKNAKGSVQFPLDQPLPTDLIRRIAKYRVEENRRKAASKKKRA